MSELAVAMAPPVSAPARGGGPRWFRSALDTTITTIEGGRRTGRYGTEGDGGVDGTSTTRRIRCWSGTAPQVHKGLPFGFELGAALGQGLAPRCGRMALALKWALVEGFHSGLGRLPDVSLQAGDRSQCGLEPGHDSPLLARPHALQAVRDRACVVDFAVHRRAACCSTRIESGTIDLTPGGPADPRTRDRHLARKGRVQRVRAVARQPTRHMPPGRSCAVRAMTAADFATT